MEKAAKIAISLPRPLLATVDEECVRLGQSRSQFVRRALTSLLDRHRRLEEQYIQGYRDTPEDEEELAWGALGLQMLAREPWD